MKIIITETQHSSVKERMVFMTLDKQNYNLIETRNMIYFVKNIGDKYAEIKYDKSDGWCRISYNLMSFLLSMTGFQKSEVKELIGKWVEHTLQMKVTYSVVDYFIYTFWLTYPTNEGDIQPY